MADWPLHYVIQNFNRFFLPPPEISTTHPLGWTPLYRDPFFRFFVVSSIVCRVSDVLFYAKLVRVSVTVIVLRHQLVFAPNYSALYIIHQSSFVLVLMNVWRFVASGE